MSKQPNNNPLAPLAIGFVIGIITLGTVILVWNHDREPSRYPVPVAPATSATQTAPLVLNSTAAITLDAAVDRVAARFVCSCGTCGEKRLDICRCETAVAERAFIQDQLRNGHSEAEAAEALNTKYGGLKS